MGTANDIQPMWAERETDDGKKHLIEFMQQACQFKWAEMTLKAQKDTWQDQDRIKYEIYDLEYNNFEQGEQTVDAMGNPDGPILHPQQLWKKGSACIDKRWEEAKVHYDYDNVYQHLLMGS